MGEREKMKLRKVFVLAILALSLVTISSCFKEDKKEESEVDKIIAMAEKMSFKELSMKAIEESNGKTFYGLGNSSRGKTALEPFIEYLKTIDPSYDMKFDWQQPKNNKIFDQLAADSNKKEGTYAMTLIQDGNQIKSKMVDMGLLKTFIPKEWASAKNINVDEYKGYLELQTLNKVFMFNNTGEKVFDNCWDFVGKDASGLFMDIDSEVVGRNFLYMLTNPKYAMYLKEAFDKLSQVEKDYFQKTIDEVAEDAEVFKLGENGKYALAWIKLWINSYNAQTDDGPICNKLAEASTVDGFGLLVYSKLRSIVETENVSANNVTVAAYQKGQEIYDGVNYEGIGGFGYCHYLFVTNNSPLPWTACAFNAYMTIINTEGKTDEEKIAGFSAWGKDMGGYSSNPDLQALNEKVFNHKKAGTDSEGKVIFDAKNDRGYDWWINEGKLVIENPEYCANVEFTVGSWIELLDRK
jgi:hypothetical protein